MTTTESSTFTTTQRTAIESLRTDLTRRIHHAVMVEYDSTDCGQHWAALYVDELPEGSWGRPGPLVTIMTGAGVPGGCAPLRGCAVMAADGSSLAHGVNIEQAVQAARFAAVREYRKMTEGALYAARSARLGCGLRPV